MALTLRLVKGSALSYAEGDANFTYLLTNMSGSNVNITGSTGILGGTTMRGTLTLSNPADTTSFTITDNGTTNASDTVMQFTSNLNGFRHIKGTNSSSGIGAAAGAIFYNDVSDYLQIYHASSGNTSITGARTSWIRSTGTALSLISDYNGGSLRFLTNDGSRTERMRITSAGNVGIGTTSPSYLLDVVGGDARFNSVRVGRGAGNLGSNLAVGVSALNSNTSGNYNIALGASTLLSNTIGNANTAIGSQALYSNIDGNNNIAVGRNSLINNINGGDNTALGFNVMYNNTTGSNNIAIGNQSLYSNITGSNNIALGYQVLNQNKQDNNIGLGYSTLSNVTTGDKNIGIGASAGTGITTGRANVIIGSVTGLASSLSNNIIIADGDGNQRISINSTGSVTLSDVLVLPFSNPLPSNRPTGSVAVSGSGGTFVGMFVYNGTTWTNVKA